jgi:hypothetical protein
VNITDARRRRAEIVATVRERGFKNGGADFTDAQIWQAVMDSRDWEHCHYWDAAAGKLLEHVIEGRTLPSSPTYESARDEAEVVFNPLGEIRGNHSTE